MQSNSYLVAIIILVIIPLARACYDYNQAETQNNKLLSQHFQDRYKTAKDKKTIRELALENIRLRASINKI